MPQRYTATDNTTGKAVTFDWHAAEPPTDADLEEVFAAARTEPEKSPEKQPRTGGEFLDKFRDDPGPYGSLVRGAEGGGMVNSPVAGAIGGLIKRAAPPLMRLAQGAQTAVKKRFPTVDLPGVALREGVGPDNVVKATRLSNEAGRDVQAALRSADDAGVPPIQPRTVVRGLRPLYDRAVLAKRPDLAGDVVDRAKNIRHELKGGISMQGSHARKGLLEEESNAVLRATDPKRANFGKRVANAERGTLVGEMRGRSPQIESTLNRSQEMLALKAATEAGGNRTPLLRALLGVTAGAGTGAVTGDVYSGLTAAALPAMMMSPRGLSTAARVVNRTAEPGTEALLRALMLSAAETPGRQ